MLVGIISKFIKALEKYKQYKDTNEFTQKKLLSEKWFDIDEAKLELYEKLYHVIFHINHAWFKSYSGIYADDFLQFTSLLNYFNTFETIKDYRKIDSKEHSEHFNTFALMRLEEYFKQMNTKLPIISVSGDDDTFYNSKGASCYKDWTKHQFLEIPVCNDGRIYKVLSVGFFRHMEQANLTIENNGHAECYLLPNELLGWAVDCVGFANMGFNPFPLQVKFGIADDTYYLLGSICTKSKRRARIPILKVLSSSQIRCLFYFPKI